MKNTTRQKKHNYPSEKTRWAYWMQAIEPTSEALNKAFPDYHPQWVQMSQRLHVGAENFSCMRKLLGMSHEQCAAYLRVSTNSIYRWERGATEVPFANFELLRLVLESLSFRMSHACWDGWFINAEGKLMSPDYGREGFTPEQLNLYTIVDSELEYLRKETTRLQTRLDESTVENTEVRQLFVANGVVDELAAMQDTINDLMARIATAKVIPFPATADQLKEKTA